jgi:Carboxypeptidase regulatory-like domain
MNQSVNGCVVDETTGEPLTSPDVRLYRIGVSGETCTSLDEHGCFSFSDLCEGEYSLAFQDKNFVPRYERLTLAQGQILPSLHIALRPGGVLSGRILDDKQQPPERCWFTLVRAGERRGESGYISDSGDHKVSDDGTFCSPPLPPARYFLRFAGILRKPADAVPTEPRHLAMQQRIFDFLYPDAQDISDATGFDVELGQTISGLQLQIPRSIWYTVRGKVTGELPTGDHRINVMFSRTMGTIDGLGGGSGPKVGQDGTFEHQVQSGDYAVEVWELAPPEPDGRTSVLRKFAATNIRVTNADLEGIEIHIPS